MVATCITINVVTPESVTSNLLTAAKDACTTTCTITGTVQWTNSGGTASVPTDLKINVNGSPTTISPLAVIAPNTATPIYPFTLSGITAGEYVISTTPTGVANQTIVINPALIVATSISSDVPDNTCTAPCPATVTATWQNTGDVSTFFEPALTITGGTLPTVTPTYASESLAPGASVTHQFSLTNMTPVSYQICPNPP